MIIVITHDATMRDYYGNYVANQRPNHQYWQRAAALDAGLSQGDATARLGLLLGQLGQDEPLCLVGHGNDEGIGDEKRRPWWWSAGDLTALFARALPQGYQGQVLIESCGASVANLPPRIANGLEGGRLRGMWIYGHQYDAGIVDPLPSARQLGGPFYPGSQVT